VLFIFPLFDLVVRDLFLLLWSRQLWFSSSAASLAVGLSHQEAISLWVLQFVLVGGSAHDLFVTP
jgi:hypothetical protein